MLDNVDQSGYSQTKPLRLIRSVSDVIRDTWASASVLSITAILLHDAISFKSLHLVLGIAIGYSYAYVLNDFYDRSYDAINPDKADRNFFVKYSFSWNGALTFTLLGIYLILGMIFAQFGAKGIFILSVSIVVPFLYSAEPIRLKSKPILDLITHGLFVSTYPYLITMYLLGLDFLKIDLVLIPMIITISITVQLENQIRDYEYDKKIDNNFTITMGKTTSDVLNRFLTLNIIIAGIVMMITKFVNLLFYPLMILLLPWLCHRLIRKRETARSEWLVKITTYLALLYVIFVIIIFYW